MRANDRQVRGGAKASKKSHRKNFGNKSQSELRLIAGKNTIEEVLRSEPGRIVEVWVGSAKSELAIQAQSAGLVVHERPHEELEEASGMTSHQGVLAWVQDTRISVKELIAKTEAGPALVVAAVGIEDPQNLGGIFRVAECLGASGVMFSRNKGVGLTPTVSKVSVGGTELVPYVEVGNFSRDLKTLQEAGFWVVASDCGTGATSVYEFEFPQRCVVLVGSEGWGINRLLLEQADYRIQIPMLGSIDSLNVGQATTVLLYEYRRQIASISQNGTSAG
jgi:23S rRNA (guanosine2251-2'-O)-methyltransferase